MSNSGFQKKRQTGKQHSQLWLLFVLSVFGIMTVSNMAIGMIMSYLFRSGYFSSFGHRPPAPFFGMLISSVIIGTFISGFIAHRVLSPTMRLSEASKEVAKGNFKVRIKEGYRAGEMREMAQNFNRMVQELDSIETLRTDFITNVSHEFKTPLAGIEGYATLLQDPNLSPEEHREYTQIIIDSTRQLSAMAGNILKLSKLENQEIITDKANYRLDEQLRQALLLLETQWSEKQIDLDLDLDEVLFYGNESLMLQVWLNLLGNAVKFTPKYGSITVTLQEQADEICVIIADTGIGMPAEIQQHIFEKFYQGDQARASHGNGLGLSLVKRIVELCEGNVTVQSQPGEGAAFTVCLPQQQ